MTDLEIEAFLAVVHAGSLSKAAEELYVSQSALSRRIKALEDELGYQLILRYKGVRSVEFTQAGLAFVESATKWKSLWNDVRDMGSLNNQTSISVSIINSVIYSVMPGFFLKFMQDNPEIYLKIRTVPSLDTFRYVENGIVDLALFSDDNYTPHPGMRPAYKEKLVLVCRKDLHYPKVVSTTDLDVAKHFYMPWNREYDAWYNSRFTVPRKPRVWFNNAQLIEELLLIGDYWAIVPASVASRIAKNSALSVHTIKDGPPDRIIYYLLGPYQKPKSSSLFLRCLDDYLRSHHAKSVVSLINQPVS